MILTCPSCETQYFADDTTIGSGGRSVKCGTCHHVWHVPATLSDNRGAMRKGLTAGGLGAHDVYRQSMRTRQQSRIRWMTRFVWLFWGVALGALVLLSVLKRNDIVKVWPQSAYFYRALGFEVNRYGLDFIRIDPMRTFDDTTPILTVTGRVMNITDTPQPAADIHISLRDEAMREIAVLIAPLDTARLEAGAEAGFEARLENPPIEAFNIQVSFTSPENMQTLSEEAALATRPVDMVGQSTPPEAGEEGAGANSPPEPQTGPQTEPEANIESLDE